MLKEVFRHPENRKVRFKSRSAHAGHVRHRRERLVGDIHIGAAGQQPCTPGMRHDGCKSLRSSVRGDWIGGRVHGLTSCCDAHSASEMGQFLPPSFVPAGDGTCFDSGLG